MRIRTKLLLAVAAGGALLVAQILAVSFFIRQVQVASTFIASAHAMIEADFRAAELVADLRDAVKQLPSGYVAERSQRDVEAQLSSHLLGQARFADRLHPWGGRREADRAKRPHRGDGGARPSDQAVPGDRGRRDRRRRQSRSADRAGDLHRQGAGKPRQRLERAHPGVAEAASGRCRPGARDRQPADHRRCDDRRPEPDASAGVRLAVCRSQSGGAVDGPQQKHAGDRRAASSGRRCPSRAVATRSPAWPRHCGCSATRRSRSRR